MGSKEEELVAEVRKAIQQLKGLPPGDVPGPLTVAELLEDALHSYSPRPCPPDHDHWPYPRLKISGTSAGAA